MQRFRKKPVVIRAIQLNHANRQRVESLLESKGMAILLGRTNECSDHCGEDAPWLDLVIPTLEGDHLAKHGDWIIEGVQGELYPCKPDIFAATHEPAPSTEGGDGVCPFCNCYTDTPHTWRDCAHDLRETAQGLAERAKRVTRDSVAAISRVTGRLAEFRLRVSEAAGCTRVVTDVTPEPFTVAASDDVALGAIRDLKERSTWRPIEECGELGRGRYLVQLRSGAQIVALCSGDSEGWVLRQRDLDEFDSPRDITHVHRMGPIRGPGETDGNV